MVQNLSPPVVERSGETAGLCGVKSNRTRSCLHVKWRRRKDERTAHTPLERARRVVSRPRVTHTGAGSTRRGPESQVGGRCPVLLALIRTWFASLADFMGDLLQRFYILPPGELRNTTAHGSGTMGGSGAAVKTCAKQSRMVRVRVLKAPKWLRRIRGMPGQPTQDASNYLALTKLHEPLVNNRFSGRAARGARREQETRVITTRWPSGRKP